MKKGLTKKVVLEKAYLLFSKKGYHAAGMEELAAEVGIRKASLYSHYSGKEEIYMEVFRDVLKKYSDVLKGIMEGLSGITGIREKLNQILSGYAEYYRDETVMNFWYKAYISPPEFARKEIFKQAMKAEMGFYISLYRFFRNAVKNKELKKQNIGHLTTTFYQILMGYGMTAAVYPKMNIKKAIAGSIEIFWNGIGTRD